MNAIEKHASEHGYFERWLPSYIPLWEARQRRSDRASQNHDACMYWAAFGTLQYTVFETLFYLCSHHESSVQNSSLHGHGGNCAMHLPTFMSAHMAGYSAAEYLTSMIALHELSLGTLSRDRFLQLIGPRGIGERKDALARFWARIAAQDETKVDWELLDPHREFRNRLTHRYRFPWWQRCGRGPYGFPSRIVSGGQEMDDVIWQSIESPAWEDELARLPQEDFVSGVQLIAQLHSDLAKVTDAAFRAFLQRIENDGETPTLGCS